MTTMAPGGAWSGATLDACANTMAPKLLLGNASNDRKKVRLGFHGKRLRKFIESLRSR